jgi:hypothetical protein
MADWFTHPGFGGALILASACIVAFAVVRTLFTSWRRSERLAKLDPPTEEELEEVRALRLAGPFQLPGRSSAPARHFERSWRILEGASRDGGRGCYEPTLVESWRDRRSADDR